MMRRVGALALSASRVACNSGRVITRSYVTIKSNNNWTRSSVVGGAVVASLLTTSLIVSSEAPKNDGSSDLIEGKVANINDLKDGDLKQVQVGEMKILLARVKGEYYATGLKCSHVGAPLDKGTLAGDQVSCPWHGAQFNVKTGKADSAPAIDNIPSYKVRISGDEVFVSVPKDAKEVAPLRRVGHRCACSGEKVYAIVGGGAAGLLAAQTLRQDGFKGRVVLITKEDDLPYDRTSLSKFPITKEKATLRDEAFYKTHDIEVMRGTEVTQVDAKEKTISFADGAKLNFEKVLLAPGGTPFVLNVPGNGQDGVLTLRSLKDSALLNEAAAASQAENKKVVVIGASFIGMETAAYLRKNKSLDVTVVGLEKTPFETVLGAEVGSAYQDLHEKNGVKFKLGRKVQEITGDGKADGVVLDNGEKLDADFVVMGVGVRPNLPKIVGANKDKDGGITVDANMKVVDGVYAAGDVARFPYSKTGDNIRVEHWCVAQDQGKVAAHNMAGQSVKYDSVPFFWTNQYMVGLRYVGYVSKPDDIIIDGDVKSRKFIAYYVKDGKVQAVASMGRDPGAIAAGLLMKADKMPSVEELRKGSVDLAERVHTEFN